MGVSISVLLESQKREDISYSDMEYQHSQIFEVLRLRSFIKHCSNETGSNEEQNPLAVTKLAKNHMFLLEKLKSWIAKEFSCLSTQNISPPIHQELIYRSPEDCQKMVVARYGVWLQSENRNTLYQGCSRSRMLVWDDTVPPPRRDAGSRGWYIVSMEVTVDKIDQGGQSPDKRNPELYLKVSLNVIRDRTWPPTDFTPCDVHLRTETYMYNNVLDPSFLTLHEANTLNPEELDQLLKSIWLGKYELLNEQPRDFMKNLKSLEESGGIVPDPPDYNKDAIHVDHGNQNTNRTSNKLSPSSNWKKDFKEKLADVTRTLPERPELSCDSMRADPQNLDAIGKLNKAPPSGYCKSVLNLNFLHYACSIVSKRLKQDTNGKSKKCSLFAKIGTVIRDILGFGPLCYIILFASIFPVPSASAPAFPLVSMKVERRLSPSPSLPWMVDHQVKFEISNDSRDKLYCILETEKYFTSYEDYEQNKEQRKKMFNETVQKLVEEQCQQQKNLMETNLWSLIRTFKVKSGELRFVVTCTLDESYKMTNETVQYIFNNRSLTNEEMIKLHISFSDVRDHTNLSEDEYLKKIEGQSTVLWEIFRAEIIPYLKTGDVSETTTLLPSSTTEATTSKKETTTSLPPSTTGTTTSKKETTTSLPPSTTGTTTSKKDNANLLAILASILAAIAIILIVIGLTLCLKFYGKKICTSVNEPFSNVRYEAPVGTKVDVEGDPKVEAPEGEDHVAILVQ